MQTCRDGQIPGRRKQRVHGLCVEMRPEACAFEKQKDNKCGWSIMREGEVGLRRSKRFTPSLNYLLTAMEGHWRVFVPPWTRN